ncbi:MAG: poly-gamma-glutamate biosynthesis protein PgsC [Christensenellales bacterium]|nr:poly-gamma-glutamate biosynthesis protein PgsC [Clostridium sp.]MDY2926150.1 poly-gamma-glutamate biosynthesis protein PgsC [Eubacteriales bacterium]MCI6987490.1 poly-gamma-glutamate biosynthesis protein PgsC [Clostridium sp.]MCI7012398.1 poly-gamma-glutamate biosynthesis protein PgsC [Clostridium sp.]MDD5904464.1 poly-gamma-glutamate biosynthesis protein PgsC [Clostridium sp.]
MTLTHFYLAIVIGTVLSLIVDEVFGIQCGGYIVPGYLAMVCDDIACVLIVFALSLITYLIINYVLPKFMILFGKRKFAVSLIVSIILKLATEMLFPMIPFASVTFRGVGAITPSLLANSYSRQGIIYTIPATLIVTYITFGLVNLLSIYI